MVVLFSIDGLILCARDALQVCKGYVFTGVCLSTVGARMAGGVCGGVCTWWGCAWQGVCMAGGGGMCGRGAYMAGESATAAGSTHPTGIHSY